MPRGNRNAPKKITIKVNHRAKANPPMNLPTRQKVAGNPGRMVLAVRWALAWVPAEAVRDAVAGAAVADGCHRETVECHRAGAGEIVTVADRHRTGRRKVQAEGNRTMSGKNSGIPIYHPNSVR